MASVPLERVGERIMQFTIEEKIQEGAFTIVYRAYDPELQRRILLKVLHKHHTADPDLRQRFLREAQACAALRSEYIVQVYALTEYDGCPAIVMEFVEGTSLKQYIADGSRHNLTTAQKVALHALRGLVAAHEHGIIHRDIKPGNILVTANGTFKISDFGLASVASVPSVTAQGVVLGTPAYMSPEQIRHEEIDQRTDLFSLGATLIEVLTGERLFDGNSYGECAKKILSFGTDDLDRFTEQSSPEFVGFLKLLMAPKKQNRFANSKEALRAFDKKESNIFIHGLPRNSSSRYRLVYIIGSTVVLLVAIIIFLPSRISDSGHLDLPRASVTNDSISALIATDSSVRTGKEPPVRKKNDPAQSHLVSPPTVILSDTLRRARTDSGSVILTSTPWAKVYVDNRYIGETPLSKPLTLAAGKHAILFVHPSFDPIMQTVNVLPFREKTVTGNFLETVGYLICLATPWAEVYINDQYRDTTPLDKPFMLSPGKYQVRFKNSSFQDIVRDVTVRAKDTTSLVVTFKGVK
jgi:serine/threonine protein kinase